MSMQEDLRKISKWSQRWEMSFNVNKYHVLQVGTRTQKFDDEMNGTTIESVQCFKDIGVTIASIMKFFQQCKEAAGKANRMLGFIKRNFSFKNKDVILPLYTSLVRPQLEYTAPFWSPHHANDIAKLEAVQRRSTKMITYLRNKSYEERLAQHGSEEKLFTNVDANKMFSIGNTSRTSNGVM